MKIDSFANRLSKAMNEQNMKQVDLANKTGIDKSLINKYLKGISEAGNDNLPLLANALNTNEVWLMGYDVSPEPSYQGVVHNDEKGAFLFYLNKSDDDLLKQYKVLFDKDNKLTENQKEFMMNTIIEQHRKVNKNQEKLQ